MITRTSDGARGGWGGASSASRARRRAAAASRAMANENSIAQGSGSGSGSETGGGSGRVGTEAVVLLIVLRRWSSTGVVSESYHTCKASHRQERAGEEVHVEVHGVAPSSSSHT